MTCGDCEKPLRGSWSKSCTGRRYAYYTCHTKGCASYGKSIRRDTIEGDFATLLKDMRPNTVLFRLITKMLEDIWNQRTKQVNEIRKALRRDLLKLDRQIDLYLDKIVDASNSRVVQAIDRKIDQLENEKVILSEKLEKSFQPKSTAAEMLELSMRFFSNPYKIWENGGIHLQKLVLRLAFSAPLPYHRETGYRTIKTTLPFNVLGENNMLECQMVPRGGIEPPTQGFSIPCSTN